jgi:hypothetical protein
MPPSLADQLAQAYNENKELKESLRRNQNAYQELKYENNFNAAKASELREIVDARTMDQVHEKLLKKSLQNAELALELDKVQSELDRAKSEMGRTSQELEASKRLLLELSDIVRTLSTVNIQYEKLDTKLESESPQDLSLKNIKRKIEAIMNDREQVIHTCQSLKEENAAQEQKIMALESNFHLLNSTNISKSEDSVGHFHGESLSRPGQNDSTDRRHLGYGGSKPHSVLHKAQGVPQLAPISPVSCSTTTSVSCASEEASFQSASSDWTSLVATKFDTFDETERVEIEKLRTQLKEITEKYEQLHSVKVQSGKTETGKLQIQLLQTNEKYEKLRNECQKVLLKMEVAERQLEESDAEAEAARKKSNAYKTHLRDAIEQYKQLHKLYDASLARIEDLETMSSILRDEKDALSEGNEKLSREHDAFIKEKETLGGDKRALMNEIDRMADEKASLLQEKSNLLEENEILIEEKQALIDEKNELIAQNKDASAMAALIEENTVLVAEKKALVEENQTLRDDQRRLRQEMRGWIASHEIHYEECKAAYSEAGSGNPAALQRFYKAAIAKIAIAERKVILAEREIETSRRQKASNDRNLRDSISHYRKLEQEQNTTLAELQAAQENLKKAKMETDRQKEEAKHVRRRLTSSLRQVTQLHQYYDSAQATITAMKAARQKEWNETGCTSETRHKMLLLEASTTANAWRIQRELQAERNLLMKEKNEIQAFFEDMLHERGEQEILHRLSAIMDE